MRVDGTQHPWRKRLSQLQTIRSEYEAQWREIGEYIAPGHVRLDISDDNKGQKKHQKIRDETVLRAKNVFVAGFVSGMTSPSRPWFKLVTPDMGVDQTNAVRVWLDDVERRMQLIFSRSNFYQAIARVYHDMGTFGTGAMTVLENRDTVAWFYPHPVGTYFVAQDEQGIVNTIYRHTTRTVAQLIETFGIDNVSNSVKTMYNNGGLEQRVEVYNAIEPNDDRARGKLDFENMPFRSVWWESGKGSTNNEYLGVRGFNEFPSVCGRWFATGLDDYGVDCPGMTSLAGVKQLNFEQLRKAQAIDKMVNPPVQAPSSLKRGNQINMLPGGVTYYDEASPNGGVRPLYETNPYIEPLLQSMEEVRGRIYESWFVDMFLMISQEEDVRTATEVAMRNEEKLLVLGPVLTRIQTEVLDPIIDRVFNIMLRNNMLPEAPAELQGTELRVEYISMLAQAQQSVGASSVERLVNTAMTMAQGGFPNALDKIDEDAVIEEYGSILGVNSRLMRDDTAVAAIRMQRAEQMQAEQMVQNAQGMAKAAKDASGVDITEGSPLARLTSG